MNSPYDLSLKGMFNLGAGIAGLLYKPSVGEADYNSKVAPAPNPYTLQEPVQRQLMAMQSRNIVNEGLMQEQQAQQVLSDAYQDVAQKSREVIEFREHQAAQYTSSGVLLEGSPMLVLERTRQLGQQEINAMANRAAAEANLMHLRNVNSQNEAHTKMLAETAGYNMDAGLYDAHAMMGAQSEVAARVRRRPGLLQDLGTLLPGYLGWRKQPNYSPSQPMAPQQPAPPQQYPGNDVWGKGSQTGAWF